MILWPLYNRAASPARHLWHSQEGILDVGQLSDGSLAAKCYFERNVYCLLGVPIDALRCGDVLNVLRRVNRHKRHFILLTPNIHDIVQSKVDRAYRDAFAISDMSIADGAPVVWLARFLGLPVFERVAGSDLFDALQEGGAGEMTVFFYGGDSVVAAAACQSVNRSRGALRCVGWIAPGFGSLEDLARAEHIDRVNQASPDLLILSLGKHGKPWIVHHAERINRGIISHLGAVINFAAGTVQRAPTLLRQMGMEWAWRILQEPALSWRYVNDALMLAHLITRYVLPLKLEQLRAAFVSRRSDTAELEVTRQPDEFIFRLHGVWTGASLDALRRQLKDAGKSQAGMTFDLSSITYLDSAVVGTILVAYGWQLRTRRPFRIAGLSKVGARILDLHCCQYLLQSP